MPYSIKKKGASMSKRDILLYIVVPLNTLIILILYYMFL